MIISYGIRVEARLGARKSLSFQKLAVGGAQWASLPEFN
jgi:hypothetical protein